MLNRGKEGENVNKWVGLIGGGLVFLIVFGAVPQVAQGLTGVNISTNPADYRVASTTRDAQGNVCMTAVAGYNPNDDTQYNDCTRVALFGMTTAQNGYTLLNTVKWAGVVIAGVVMMVGGVMFRLNKQEETHVGAPFA